MRRARARTIRGRHAWSHHRRASHPEGANATAEIRRFSQRQPQQTAYAQKKRPRRSSPPPLMSSSQT